MKKLRVGIIYGGRSGEHEVSLASAAAVFQNRDPERYGRVAIRIEDDGPGIPETAMPRLFTPFFTTKADGTGLGLAYSRKVIDGMNGEIELTNREGGGAVLTVRLPKAE